jgi:exopolysaccharide production protein ExoZ
MSSLPNPPPSPVAPEQNERGRASIDNIQVLRAVAALLVVFVHLDWFLRVLGLRPFGHGGVDLFFVISGFIMVYTTRGRAITPAAFLLNRVTRIAPIYWLITLSVFAVALVAPSLLQATSSDPEQLSKSLLFIPFQKANGLVQPVLFVGWTLNFEMFFYVLFALGLTFPKRYVGAGAVVALLGALVVLGLVARPEGVVTAFYTRPILLEFAAGMTLGALGPAVKSTTAFGRRALVAACLISLVATALVPLALPHVLRVITQGIPATLVAASAIVLHQSGVTLALGARSLRALLLLGNASYSIYLTHPFVTQALQKLGKQLGSGTALTVLLIGVTLLAVCAVGIITHLLVERPLTKAVKGLTDRLVASSHRPEPAPGYVRVD